MPRCWSMSAARLERGTAVLCPKPWTYSPTCLLSALERLQPVITSIRATGLMASGKK